MAKIITRVWKSAGPSGHRVKRVAHGYRLVVNGKDEKVTRAEWTKDAPERAGRSPPRTRCADGSRGAGDARPGGAGVPRLQAREGEALHRAG
jgi:hypothetical protein